MANFAFIIIMVMMILAVFVATTICHNKKSKAAFLHKDESADGKEPVDNTPPVPDDPTLVLNKFLKRGNKASNVLTRTYRDLEKVCREQDKSIRILRAKYTQSFINVANALDTCYDAKENPNHYEDPEELNHTVTNALNALNATMNREIRMLKQNNADNAEAAADYLIHSDDGINNIPL